MCTTWNSLEGFRRHESMAEMEFRLGRKTAAFLYLALGAIALLLQLGLPHFAMARPLDAASISSDIFHGIGYMAGITLIFCGIRKWTEKR
jgi:hypothetical protein